MLLVLDLIRPILLVAMFAFVFIVSLVVGFVLLRFGYRRVATFFIFVPTFVSVFAVVFVFAFESFSRPDVGPDLDLGPKRVSLSDTNVTLMFTAIAAVDREALGFTPISTNAQVLLETVDRVHWKREYPPPLYDAMLHIYGETHRTIAFRVGDSYRWIGEQEVHYGPKNFTDANGSSYKEHLVIKYQTEPINGIPVNQIYVSYMGEDSRLAGRHDLTLTEIKPILDSWKGIPIR